jgi:protein TonB
LELAINANGRVESVSVVKSSGYPELDAAAIRAATKARFVPAKAGKNAISSVARLTISFRLTAR